MSIIRGQAAFEYLLLIGGSVLVAAVLLVVVTRTGDVSSGVVGNSSDDYSGRLQALMSTGGYDCHYCDGVFVGLGAANSVTSAMIVDGSVGAADVDSAQVQLRVSGSCPVGSSIRGVGSDGNVTCQVGIVPSQGVVGSADINSSQVQRRVSGSCTVGSYITAVAVDGSVSCGAVAAQNTTWNTSGSNMYSAVSGNVGIKTAYPSQALDVNGKILMQNETATTDPSNTVVTKGYLSSYSSPTIKILVGSQVTCPVGTDLLMRCSGNPCTWYDSDYSLGTWSKVMCGQKLSSDGSALLVYNQHTANQCTALGNGAVTYDVGGGVLICRLPNSASCPATWTQYGSWSATTAASTSVYYSEKNCGYSCSTSSHGFSNVGVESCEIDYCFLNQKGAVGCFIAGSGSIYCERSYSRAIATATVTQIGCY